MKKLWKILIPALVILSVLACLFAVGAFAETTEGTEGTDGTDICWEIFDAQGKSVNKSAKLYSAVNACPDGGTIKPLFDKINWNDDYADFRNHNKTVTIDFGTSTVICNSPQGNAFNFIDNSNVILKGNGATLEIPAGKRFCDMASGNLTVDGVNIIVNSGRLLNTTIAEGQTIEFRNCELTTLGTTGSDRMFVISSSVNTNPLKLVNCTLTGYSDQMFDCTGGWIDISGTSKVKHLCTTPTEPLLNARSAEPYTRFTVSSGVRFNRSNVSIGQYTEESVVGWMLANDAADADFPYVRVKEITSSSNWLAYRKDGKVTYQSSLYSAANDVPDGGTIYSLYETVSYEERDGLWAMKNKSITLDLGKTVLNGTFSSGTDRGMIIIEVGSSLTVKGDGAVINIGAGNRFLATSRVKGSLTVDGVSIIAADSDIMNITTVEGQTVEFRNCTLRSPKTVITATMNVGNGIAFRNCIIESDARAVIVSSDNTTVPLEIENTTVTTTADDAFVFTNGWLNVTGSSRLSSKQQFVWSNKGTMKLTLADGARFSHKSVTAGQLTSDSTSTYSDYIYEEPSDATFPYVMSHEKANLVFNYSDKSAGCTDTWKLEKASGAMAIVRYAAYLDSKAITGWSRTEGGAAEEVSVSYADLGKTVNYYAVTADFAAEGIKYVMLSGETVTRYGTEDSFYGINGAGDFGAIAANSDTTVVFVDDMTVYGAAETNNLGAVKKLTIDLNGHTLTADTTDWKTPGGYNYIFRIQGADTETHIYSSKPGAVINAGSFAVAMLNWTGDLYIGGSSYAGNLTLVSDSAVVRHNASGNVTVTGTTINAANGFEFALRRVDTTFTFADSDANIKSAFIFYTRDTDQKCALTADIKNSSLFINENLAVDNDAMNIVKTDITVTGSTLYVSNATLPGKVTGSVTITGGKTYVNAADGIVLDTGKALRPTVVNKNGVTFTKTVAGESEIAGVKFNLTLYSSFNLNLYVLSEYGLGGDTVEIDGHTYTRHEYSYAAHEIAEAQNIKLGSYDAISVSVLDYAKVLFALDDSALMSNEKTLMADALVYANAAAKFIDKAENAEITALLTANKDYKSTLKTFNGKTKDMTSVSDGFVSASLDLTSQPRFIFTIKSGAKVSVSYTNFWGVKVTKTEADAVDGKIIIDDMRIFDFANEFTLTVGEKRTTYSLADYAANTDVQELCNALYTYIETAKAFKAKNPKV